MKILVLTNEYPYDKYPKSNWTKVVKYFCEEWAKLGHEVVVIVNSTRFPQFYYISVKYAKGLIAKIKDINTDGLEDHSWCKDFEFSEAGVRVFNYPMLKLFPGSRFSKKIINKQFDKIDLLMKKINFLPDVVTGHWLNPQLPLLVKIGKKYHIPTTLVFHGDYSEKRLRKMNAVREIKNITHVGCRSKTASEVIKQRLKLTDRPFLCASGIPDEYIPQNGRCNTERFDSDCLSIISAGRLVKYKCFDSIIVSLTKEKPSFSYNLKIYGDGELKENLKKRIVDRKVEDRIKLCGQVTRETLQNAMENSQIFVLISRNETFGLVYLEAMIHGCIVIASKNGGVDGIIEDGINGFLCRAGDSKELQLILSRIATMDNFEKKNISEKAIQTAMSYTDSKTSQAYLNCISQY